MSTCLKCWFFAMQSTIFICPQDIPTAYGTRTRSKAFSAENMFIFIMSRITGPFVTGENKGCLFLLLHSSPIGQQVCSTTNKISPASQIRVWIDQIKNVAKWHLSTTENKNKKQFVCDSKPAELKSFSVKCYKQK